MKKTDENKLMKTFQKFLNLQWISWLAGRRLTKRLVSGVRMVEFESWTKRMTATPSGLFTYNDLRFLLLFLILVEFDRLKTITCTRKLNGSDVSCIAGCNLRTYA